SNIDTDKKGIGLYCLIWAHDTLHSSPGRRFDKRLAYLSPSGCQRSSARDAWSMPQDTVQSSDTLGSWGTLFASRSTPPLSRGPHHNPGATRIIQAMLMRIIRAVIRRHLYHQNWNLHVFVEQRE